MPTYCVKMRIIISKFTLNIVLGEKMIDAKIYIGSFEVATENKIYRYLLKKDALL